MQEQDWKEMERKKQAKKRPIGKQKASVSHIESISQSEKDRTGEEM